MKTIFYTALFICCYIGNQSAAQTSVTRKLMVGDAAPALKIEKWLKGNGPETLKKGKVYIIDLWAIWCVPCIAGMPHLGQLQKKYKNQGLEVIGITNNDPYGNNMENVVKFVKGRDSIIKYNMAWVPESSDSNMKGIFVHPWMQQAGTKNLPTAFLVDREGRIAYIGDPHTIDSALAEVMRGTYDIQKLKDNYVSALMAEETCRKFETALKENNIPMATTLANDILNNHTFIKPNTLLILGSQIATFCKTNNADAALLELGLKAARRGVILTGFESPGFLSTLASVYAAKKDYVLAVITQELAINMSEGGMKAAQMKELEEYRSLLSTK